MILQMLAVTHIAGNSSVREKPSNRRWGISLELEFRITVIYSAHNFDSRAGNDSHFLLYISLMHLSNQHYSDSFTLGVAIILDWSDYILCKGACFVFLCFVFFSLTYPDFNRECSIRMKIGIRFISFLYGAKCDANI